MVERQARDRRSKIQVPVQVQIFLLNLNLNLKCCGCDSSLTFPGVSVLTLRLFLMVTFFMYNESVYNRIHSVDI